jgi:dTDP-glucose 4,6-dehydratase
MSINITKKQKICLLLNDLNRNKFDSYLNLIKHVKDRPGHDTRYAINNKKIKKLGWKPKVSLENGLSQTINWYLKNQKWITNANSKVFKKWIKKNYDQRNLKF